MRVLADAIAADFVQKHEKPVELTVDQLKELPPVKPGFVQELWPAEKLVPEAEVLLAAQDFGYQGDPDVKKAIAFLEKANLARFASRQ